jgi:hypothetical protein
MLIGHIEGFMLLAALFVGWRHTQARRVSRQQVRVRARASRPISRT